MKAAFAFLAVGLVLIGVFIASVVDSVGGVIEHREQQIEQITLEAGL